MNEIMIECPVCGRIDIVLYTRKPPVYCSAACKQKAYRQRKSKSKKRNVSNVTLSRLERRFGKSAGYRLYAIYRDYGHQVGNECERAVFEAANALYDAKDQG